MGKYSQEDIRQLRKLRWRARTDLLFLCNHILGYPDVNEKTHGPVIDRLQKFLAPSDEAEAMKHDFFDGKEWVYRPLGRHQDLVGSRRMLYLDPRGHLKSTINTIAHTIQFIINYPNIACMISVANTERAKILLREICDHFTKNEIFRKVFPEHCPPANKADLFGTQDGFTTMARDFSYEAQKVRKEQSVHVGSIEKAVASLHYDVIKFSDIVDEENSQTREQCQKIVNSYSAKLPAVVDYRSWVYLEGTRYHNDDLYGQVMVAEMDRQLAKQDKLYDIFMRGCFKKVNPSYNIDDLEKPFELDENGQFIAIFPEKMPVEALLAIKNDPVAGKTFNEQYLNDPTPTEDSKLPVTKDLPCLIKPSTFATKVKVAYYEMSVDFAETLKQKSDFTVISVMAWDYANRPYIVQIERGKFKDEEKLVLLKRLYQKYKPQRIYIEESSYNRGFFPSIDRVFKMNNLYPLWEWLPRKGVKKENRIDGCVSVWWKSKTLRFVYDENEINLTQYPAISREAMDGLRKEARAFPRGAHDDILDTIADLLSQKTYFARLGPRDIDDPEVAKSEWQRMIEGPTGQQMQYNQIFGEGTVIPSWATGEYGGF